MGFTVGSHAYGQIHTHIPTEASSRPDIFLLLCCFSSSQVLALIKLHRAPNGPYKNEVFHLCTKMDGLHIVSRMDEIFILSIQIIYVHSLGFFAHGCR